MVNKISDFIYSFKNKVVEAKELLEVHNEKINSFASFCKEQGFEKEYEENFLTILGYSYRLDDINQRLFFTFQEAVYAIDLDKLMRNEDSLKLNSIVYILVLDFIIAEAKNKTCDEEIKEKALDTYKEIEQRKANENKKYHMYQN